MNPIYVFGVATLCWFAGYKLGIFLLQFKRMGQGL